MTGKTPIDIAGYVSKCLQLALLLEVSAYPKPGNVHRIADFQETKYEHFLASAVAVVSSFRKAAQKGISATQEEMKLSEIGIGKIIKDAVGQVMTWQSGGNTLLGTIILLTPLAAAAGISLTKKPFSTSKLRKNIKLVVESTTPSDAVDVYDAISLAKPGGLGKTSKLDTTDPASKQKILRDKISLFDVFKISSSWDSISFEWVNNYPITFDLGYPYFVKVIKKTNDVNVATVHTFLKVLSEVSDTLIARKVGIEKANEVSKRAEEVLKQGGLTTTVGRQALSKFDKELRDSTHQLNPGTTADITVAVLAISILNGYRP